MLVAKEWLSIEGNPFITRFKTYLVQMKYQQLLCIEGNPFITRFKTQFKVFWL